MSKWTHVGTPALAGLLLASGLAGCQAPLKPVMADGAAGYEAIAVAADSEPQSYRLAAGDIIAVRVFGEEELTVEDALVDTAGNVSLPLIGEMRAAGGTSTDLAARVTAAYGARYLRDPRVSVLVKKAHERTIAVEGEVEQPGVFPYAEGQTLLTALALARSPTDTAKLDEVMVFRTVEGQRLAGRFDAQAIRGGRAPDVALRPGDVVVVGYSSVRGAYLDALKALPVLGVFRTF